MKEMPAVPWSRERSRPGPSGGGNPHHRVLNAVFPVLVGPRDPARCAARQSVSLHRVREPIAQLGSRQVDSEVNMLDIANIGPPELHARARAGIWRSSSEYAATIPM